MDYQQDKAKFQAIAMTITDEINVGHLRPGDRIQSVRTLADKFNVSIKSVQYAFDSLERDGLIERKAGSGTFVKNKSVSASLKAIKLLTPVLNMSSLPPYPQHVFRVCQDGLLSGAGRLKRNVELVPISTSNKCGDIEWTFLKDLNENDDVIVLGSWYRALFQFLQERKCRVVYFDNSYIAPEHLDIAKNWCRVRFSYEDAFSNIAAHLKAVGFKKIAVCKRYNGSTEKDDPPEYSLIDAHRHALISNNLKFSPALYQPFHCQGELKGEQLRDNIIKLWKDIKFDSLVLYSVGDVQTVISTLTKDLKLRVPEDAAVVNWGDYPFLQQMSPSVSAMSIPFFEMAEKAADLLCSGKLNNDITILPTKISIRNSTVKNASSDSYYDDNYMVL